MATDFSYKTTVRQLTQHYPGAQFFRELIDVNTTKCYGIQLLSREEVKQAEERFVGFYGQLQREFTAPFDIQRGHRIVTVSASKKKPIRCFEHIYAEL